MTNGIEYYELTEFPLRAILVMAIYKEMTQVNNAKKMTSFPLQDTVFERGFAMISVWSYCISWKKRL